MKLSIVKSGSAKHTTFHRKQNSKKPDEIVTDPVTIFHQAIENAKPVVGVQPIKKAGKTYQVSKYIKLVLNYDNKYIITHYPVNDKPQMPKNTRTQDECKKHNTSTQ